MMVRKILHLDLDAFFCAVEELKDPTLRGKAFAVGGRADQRGVIASCSYAARRLGVHSAMPTSQAMRLCPGLIVISHHHGNYGDMSKKVMERLNDLSPLVEQISIDEAFVDISDLQETAKSVALRIQKQVNEELGLPCSVGVATNKLVAKIATEVGKKTARKDLPPNAVTVVPPGTEAAFLAPLHSSMLWGVGPKTASRLAEIGIKTIGDIASASETDLVHHLGDNARHLIQRARGVDESPLSTSHEIKSISQETTFARDISDDRQLASTVRNLSATVGKRLRTKNLAGTTIRIKLRYPDFTTLTRQVSYPQPTDQDEEIYHLAMDLLAKVRPKGKAVRLIGVGVSGLCPPIRQLELWGAEVEKARRLQDALDEVRTRFGTKAITRGKK